jgi:hypothetical protein
MTVKKGIILVIGILAAFGSVWLQTRKPKDKKKKKGEKK